MRYRHRSQLSPRHGFTLVELMVVIAIIAALGSLAVLIVPRLPGLRDVVSMQLESAGGRR